MTTYFCPVCWHPVHADDRRCPACDADLAALDRESFDAKLMRALGSPTMDTVMRAVEILGARQVSAAVPSLVGRYEAGADPYLAAAIARALGQIGTPTALAALERLRADPSVLVRHAADLARSVRPT